MAMGKGLVAGLAISATRAMLMTDVGHPVGNSLVDAVVPARALSFLCSLLRGSSTLFLSCCHPLAFTLLSFSPSCFPYPQPPCLPPVLTLLASPPLLASSSSPVIAVAQERMRHVSEVVGMEESVRVARRQDDASLRYPQLLHHVLGHTPSGPVLVGRLARYLPPAPHSPPPSSFLLLVSPPLASPGGSHSRSRPASLRTRPAEPPPRGPRWGLSPPSPCTARSAWRWTARRWCRWSASACRWAPCSSGSSPHATPAGQPQRLPLPLPPQLAAPALCPTLRLTYGSPA
eukprot:762010-Hanusia_phi.AAC.1